jgi:hypothetical protein
MMLAFSSQSFDDARIQQPVILSDASLRAESKALALTECIQEPVILSSPKNRVKTVGLLAGCRRRRIARGPPRANLTAYLCFTDYFSPHRLFLDGPIASRDSLRQNYFRLLRTRTEASV